MSWAEHVACVESVEKSRGFWWGNVEYREHLEVDDFIIVNKYSLGIVDWINLAQNRKK